MKSIQIFILFLLCSIAVKAQITVDNTVTPIDAMQTLLGDNVTISNLNYVGNATQIGVFDCIDCGLDFNNGIIISTGDVATAVGPNDQGGAGTSFVNGPLSNSDLDFISPTPDNYFDIAILEFDFVALGDSVWFEYIWASEEYHFYTVEDGPFDVFGLLISGPDINGAYSDNAENIALVPTTGEGVSNVTINNGQQNTGPCYNCEYLVSNGEGQIGEPQTTDVTVVQYDAYTTGLVASQGNLTCGETYHLKLIIADVQDGIFDSAIILKAGSLSSNLSVGVELQIEATNQEGVMNEECGVSELIFTRPESISTNIPFTVNIVYSGVAVNGVDYSALPEVIVFDPGVDVISFTLDAFEDGIIEGLESVILEMQSVAVCQGESIPSVFEFAITESTPPLIEGYDIDICDGTEIEITPLITGGSGGFLYEWNTTETTSSILVSPGSNTTYSVTLSDTCLVSTGATDINVNVSQFPDIVVNTTPNNIDIDCNWFGEGVSMTASGGDGTYNYAWLDEEGNSLGLGDNTYIFDNSCLLYTSR
ncbi:MAG: choice-of-anchor L domain-containing protein, partial [Flavobacteriales bacterium]